MIIRNVKRIKYTLDNKGFEIYCKRPLKLNEIKDLIRKEVKELKDFDVAHYSIILDEKDNLNRLGMLNKLTVIRN